MGKQVNFFMLGTDESVFHKVLTDHQLCVVPAYVTEPSIFPYNVLPGISEVPRGAEACIVRAQDINGIILDFFEGIRLYAVDVHDSNVIQFNRCRLDAGTLFRGRIWAEMSAPRLDQHGREVSVYKGDDFESSFNSLAQWIRRNYKRDPQYGFYCGPQAYEWYLRGGQLSQH